MLAHDRLTRHGGIAQSLDSAHTKCALSNAVHIRIQPLVEPEASRRGVA
jgi:hypothetical protein